MDGMLRQMPAHLLTEWMAYYNLEPFGEEVMDHHLATMTAILFNANRPKKEKARQPKDYKLWKQLRKAFDASEFFSNLKGYLER